MVPEQNTEQLPHIDPLRIEAFKLMSIYLSIYLMWVGFLASKNTTGHGRDVVKMSYFTTPSLSRRRTTRACKGVLKPLFVAKSPWVVCM